MKKVELLARAGCTTKGVLYVILGVLATMVALGEKRDPEDSKGVLQYIASQPFGGILVGAMGLGLAAYGLWRLVEAALDPQDAGAGRMSNIAVRSAYALSGLLHLALAVAAFQLVLGGTGRGDTGRSYLHEGMSSDAGRIGVVLIAIGVAIAALFQFKNAITGDFEKQLKIGQMSHSNRIWIGRLGRFGLAARGVVFSIMAFFLFRAAELANASVAKGTGGVLRKIQSQSYGEFLLFVVAIGFVAYGVFMGVSAHYRKI